MFELMFAVCRRWLVIDSGACKFYVHGAVQKSFQGWNVEVLN